MKEYDKFTTISNSVAIVEFEDTDIDPDILIIKVRTKREKKAENLKFEI